MMNAVNETSETITKSEAVEDPFVFCATLPSLKEMASYQMALAIWYSYIADSKHNEFKKETNDELINCLGVKDKYWEECSKIVESLKLPSSIKKILEMTMDSVRERMRSWIHHFKFETFSYGLKRYYIQHYDANCCVWFPNGEINYVKTGPRMLTTPGLTDLQKFAIMCEFCMENDIHKFSLDSLPKLFIRQLTFDQDFLMYYWVCYLNNELQKIPLNNFSSIDIVMAMACQNTHWTAFKYFWNRLGIDDQVTVAVFRFRDHGTCLNQGQTLSMMSCQQQHRVLSQISDEVLLNFWVRLDSPQSAMWTWKHCKDLMPVEKFAKVIKEIFYCKVPFEEEIRLLMEIWNTASNEQRNHFIRTMDHKIIRPFFHTCGHSLAAFKLLEKFLSMKNKDFRRSVMLENACEFGSSINNPNSMKKIINLCLPDPSDQLEYRKLIMESHEMAFRGELLFADSNFENLKLRVQFYSLDASMAQEYLKRLLESKTIKKAKYITDFDKWMLFDKFVDDIFSNDAPSALNLKKEFIMSYASTCLNDWNDDDSLNEMNKVLATVFSMNELDSLKQAFLNSFQKVLVDTDYWPWFEEKYFNKFVSWCIGNEQGVDAFKKTISVDAIFDEYFSWFNGWYCDSGDFDDSLLPDLDTCLRWYFEGIEGARKYKLHRINGFNEIAIFRNILKENDEVSLEVLLKWFFDNDESSVHKFRAKRIKL